MAGVPTATKVLDGFLAARAASVVPAALAADREVVGWLCASVSARGVEPIDDLTAYLLSHSTGRLPTDRELAAVLAVVEAIPDFFSAYLPGTVGASPAQVTHAAHVVRLLGRWLLARRLVDADIYAHLACYTSLYDGEGNEAGSRVAPTSGKFGQHISADGKSFRLHWHGKSSLR